MIYGLKKIEWVYSYVTNTNILFNLDKRHENMIQAAIYTKIFLMGSILFFFADKLQLFTSKLYTEPEKLVSANSFMHYGHLFQIFMQFLYCIHLLQLIFLILVPSILWAGEWL